MSVQLEIDFEDIFGRKCLTDAHKAALRSVAAQMQEVAQRVAALLNGTDVSLHMQLSQALDAASGADDIDRSLLFRQATTIMTTMLLSIRNVIDCSAPSRRIGDYDAFFGVAAASDSFFNLPDLRADIDPKNLMLLQRMRLAHGVFKYNSAIEARKSERWMEEMLKKGFQNCDFTGCEDGGIGSAESLAAFEGITQSSSALGNFDQVDFSSRFSGLLEPDEESELEPDIARVASTLWVQLEPHVQVLFEKVMQFVGRMAQSSSDGEDTVLLSADMNELGYQQFIVELKNILRASKDQRVHVLLLDVFGKSIRQRYEQSGPNAILAAPILVGIVHSVLNEVASIEASAAIAATSKSHLHASMEPLDPSVCSA